VLASFEQIEGQPVEGTNMTVIDLATGESRPLHLPEFASGDAQFKLEPTGGKLIFRGSSGTEAGAYAIDQDLHGDAQLLGTSWYFAPSATDGRVWLMILDPDSPPTVGGLKAVREVTVDGRTTVEDTGPPPGDWVVGAVGDGLLIQEDGLLVWDPRSGRIVSRLDGVFPVDTRGDVVAWCESRCPELRLTDVATGEDIAIEPPEGLAFEETYNGAFSPDGRWLAAPVKHDGVSKVAIVDMESESARLVPDSSLTPYQLLTWSPAGDWLIFGTAEGTLSAYRPDTGESMTIPLDEAQTFFAMAAVS
jgi:WD40 repeat protein